MGKKGWSQVRCRCRRSKGQTIARQTACLPEGSPAVPARSPLPPNLSVCTSPLLPGSMHIGERAHRGYASRGRGYGRSGVHLQHSVERDKRIERRVQRRFECGVKGGAQRKALLASGHTDESYTRRNAHQESIWQKWTDRRGRLLQTTIHDVHRPFRMNRECGLQVRAVFAFHWRWSPPDRSLQNVTSSPQSSLRAILANSSQGLSQRVRRTANACWCTRPCPCGRGARAGARRSTRERHRAHPPPPHPRDT
eukprot:6175945-Pleurochrysis_carterae.AAC.3